MSTGAQFVTAAYGVVLFALLVYVVVTGLRSARVAREAELLATLVERGQEGGGGAVVTPPQRVEAPNAPPRA